MMSTFELFGALAALTSLFGLLNYRFVRLPDNIGIAATGLILSLALVAIGGHVPAVESWSSVMLDRVNFAELVFHGFLGVLLFAGSLHLNIADLSKSRVPIFLLATVGVLISTAVVGLLAHLLLKTLNISVPLLYCFIFGAAISPTDPIAVLGLLKNAGVTKSLETSIVGESMFNDGTAVVTYLALLGMATGAPHASGPGLSFMFATEIGGGLLLGLGMGYLVVGMLKGLDSYPVEILITLALATGGYALAERCHVSAPLAVVVAGLVIGNVGVHKAMSDKTREHLFSFWGLMDEILNLLLFGLIGLKMLSFAQLDVPWLAVILMVPVVLFARWLSVMLPWLGLRLMMPVSPHASKILTWGGLRGGISIALVLSLPEFEGKSTFLMGTYVVVLFSLLVQAPTLPWLLKRLAATKAR